MGAVFISYRRDDTSAWAGRLRDRLAREFGDSNVFFDVDSIGYGRDFREVITSTLVDVYAMVVLIGQNWQPELLASADDFVRLELAEALSQNKVIFPVLVENATMPDSDRLPGELRTLSYLNAARLRRDPDFHTDVERLINAIRPFLIEADRVEAERVAAEADRVEAERVAAEADRVEAERVAAEADRVEAERVAAEADRVEAERVAAEADRVEAERVAAEADRVEAERVAAEADRVEAERVAAEADRVEAERVAVFEPSVAPIFEAVDALSSARPSMPNAPPPAEWSAQSAGAKTVVTAPHTEARSPLWWLLIVAIVGGFLLLFLISRCGDDENDSVTTAIPTANAPPTVDPLITQRQSALDVALSEYPGVTGDVIGTVAVLNGTVVDDREKALVDQAARAVSGLTDVQNNLTVAPASAPGGFTLNELIASQPELSTLRALLEHAGIDATLDGNGPFTLFAPTDDAFAAVQSQLDTLGNDRAALQQLLQNHVVDGTVSGAEVAASATIRTLEGELIDISVQGGEIRLNHLVPVLVGDAFARNGVMHVIAGVLFPPSLSAATPDEIGAALDLAPITFAPGSADLTDEGKTELDRVIAFLADNPTNIEIGGHTDADGDSSLNQSLSQARADAVKDYLASQGVPTESLIAIGYGEDQPIAPNDTASNKALNRRIEFIPL